MQVFRSDDPQCVLLLEEVCFSVTIFNGHNCWRLLMMSIHSKLC